MLPSLVLLPMPVTRLMLSWSNWVRIDVPHSQSMGVEMPILPTASSSLMHTGRISPAAILSGWYM